MKEVDIIITDTALAHKVLETLHDMKFRWKDGASLMANNETILDELENGNAYLTVYEDKTVAWEEIELRDESNKCITDYDFLNSNTLYLEENYDSVNRPSHYADTRYQPIEVIDDWGLDFCLGNAIKYIKRAGHKKSGTLTDNQKEIEDLEKAVWYINHKIQLLVEADNKGE